MKLASAILLAAATTAAAKKPAKKAVDMTASHKVSGPSARKLVHASRKLEDEENNNNNNNNQDDEYYFLTNYRMKFIQCVPDYKVSGEDAYEYSAVIYRLCPNDVESESAFGCTDEEAYGDYVVGINTYTQAIAENMQEEAEQNGNNNNNNGNDFNLEEYAECREADMDMDEDDEDRKRRRAEQQYWYFIGPKCIDVYDDKGKNVVGSDIGLGFFSDEYCSQESEVTYYELTGQEIPYSSGGLGGQYTSCSGYNDDGEQEVKEMCQRLTEDVALRCDEYYNGGCEEIESLEAEMKAREAKSNGGKIFLIILIALLVLGGAFWFIKKQKAKKAAANGEEPSTGGFFSQLC